MGGWKGREKQKRVTITFPYFFFTNQHTLWGLLWLIAIAFSLQQTGIWGQAFFNPGGLKLLGQFLHASLHPDFTPEFIHLTLDATITTLAYAVCGSFLSVILGLIGGIFASQVWWLAVWRNHRIQQPIWLTIRTILAAPRAIHEMLWGLLFVNIWGLDPLVAILAIAIPFGAVTAKVFAEILDETPRQPLLTLLNSGVAPLHAFIYTLFPQAFLNLLSYVFYRFECSLRSAAVLGIIGAGGLGYQILLSLKSLRYEQLWTLFYALLILNGTVDFISAWLRNRLGCTNRLDLQMGKLASSKLRSYQRDKLVILTSIGILILIPVCFCYIKADFSQIWSIDTLRTFSFLIPASFPPQLSLNQLPSLLSLSSQTLAMSILAISLAGMGGTIVAFLGADNFWLRNRNKKFICGAEKLPNWLIFYSTRATLLLFRAIPAPIWALIALFVLFPGILPGAIALGIHNLGILGRLMAEVVENLEKPPLEALKAQGTPAALVFLYGVLPLTLPRFLAYILYRWEVCLRETIIVGLVGAGGLGSLLSEQLSSFDTQGIIITLGCLIVLTLLVDHLSAAARKSFR